MLNRRNFLSLLVGGVTACFGIKKKKESVLAWAKLPKPTDLDRIIAYERKMNNPCDEIVLPQVYYMNYPMYYRKYQSDV